MPAKRVHKMCGPLVHNNALNGPLSRHGHKALWCAATSQTNKCVCTLPADVAMRRRGAETLRYFRDDLSSAANEETAIIRVLIDDDVMFIRHRTV